MIAPLKKHIYFFVVFFFILFVDHTVKAANGTVISGGVTNNTVQYANIQRRLVKTSSDWYYFYNDSGEIKYKKSSDGTTWGGAVNVDNSDAYNFNPSVWLSGTSIYVSWLDTTDNVLELRSIDTSNSDNLGIKCQSPLPDSGNITSGYMTSVAVAQDGTVYAAYSDASDYSQYNSGSNPVGLYKVNYGTCGFTDINGPVLFYDGDRPQLVTVNNALHLINADYGYIYHSIYNGTTWSTQWDTVAENDDNSLSVTTDGTNLYLATYIDPYDFSYLNDPMQGNTPIEQSNHLFKWNGAAWSTITSPYKEIDSSSTLIQSQDDSANVTQVGSDGFARILNYNATSGSLEFIQCTNATCSTKNKVSIGSQITYINNAAAMVLGSDGFGRIVYSTNIDDNIHLVTCTNASCSSYSDTVVDSSGVSGTSYALEIADDTYPRIAYINNAAQIKFIQCTNASCSTSNTEVLEDYNLEGMIPYYLSMDLGPDNYARLLFFERNSGNLRFLRCTNASCSSFNGTNVDTSGNLADMYSSMRVLPNGNAIIAYGLSVGSSEAEFTLTSCTNANCSTYGIQSLTGFSIQAYSNSGISIAITENGLPRISFTEYKGGNLDYMECLDSPCGIYKILRTAESNAAPLGNTYLGLNSRGEPYVSYFSNTGSGLKYKGCGDGTCATNVYGIALTYDIADTRLYFGIIKNDTLNGYYKYTDVSTISWSSETSLGLTSGDIAYMSSNMTAETSNDLGIGARVSSDLLFFNNLTGTPNITPELPNSLGSAHYVDGSISTDTTPQLQFTLSDQDVGDTIKYQIQIDNDSDFLTLVLDYTSSLGSQGVRYFTVGQAEGSGTYTIGTEGQSLSDGSYYWRVKAIDSTGAESVYESANSGDVAFVIDNAPAIVPLQKSYLFNTSSDTISSTATDVTVVSGVSWRFYVSGQNLSDGWNPCVANDGSFNSATENFDCIITQGANEREVVEIRSTDNQDISSILYATEVFFDTTNKVDAWFDLSNTTDLGVHYSQIPSLESPTVGASVSVSDGKYSTGALAFDGTTYIDVGDPSGYLDYADDPTDSQFTIGVRFKPSSSMIGVGGNLVSRGNWSIAVDGNGNLNSIVALPDGLIYTGLSSLHTVVDWDAWNDARLTWNQSTKSISLRLNDNKAVTSTYLFKRGLAASAVSMHIGEEFIGEIDDLIFYNTADSEPPVISIASITNSSRVTTKTPTFDVTFTDVTRIASAEYLLLGPTPYDGVGTGIMDDEAWINIPEPSDGSWDGTNESVSITTPPLIDGNWTLYVRAQDIYGNKSLYFETSANYSYYPVTSPFVTPFYSFYIETVDTTAPRIYANPVLPDPTIDRNPAIRGYVKDYLVLGDGDTSSNISQIRYSIDGGDFVNVLPVDGVYNNTYEDFYIDIPASLAPGSHTFQISASDSAVDFNGVPASNSTANNTVGDPLGDYVLTFNVSTDAENTTPETIVKDITFDNRDVQDTIFSNAIWGNGIVRLRQTIDFNSNVIFGATLHDAFGYQYGESTVAVYPSVDGNMWLATNDGEIIYYNKNTNVGTDYTLRGVGTHVAKIYEFTDSGDRYLLLTYTDGLSSLMYDINNTPENTADDPAYVDYGDKIGFSNYKTLSPSFTDTRGATLALIGSANEVPASDHNAIIRIDLKGNPMDLASQTYTLWGESEGLGVDLGGYVGNNMTAFYFDQDAHLFIASSYTAGLFVCDDNNTPENKADDYCTRGLGNGSPVQAFAIMKDPNGWYWVGGDSGLVRVRIEGAVSSENFTYASVLASSDISNDQIANLAFVQGEYPVGDEVWMMTRQGRIRALEYNFTYEDALDDTNYVAKIPEFEYRAGGVSTFIFEDKNTIWLPVAGQGLVKILLDRGFENSNIVEIYPNPPVGFLEVDNVELKDIVGSVTSGSSYTFDQLVTYEISNDAGITWYEASPETPIRFTTSDYKLKVRITLHKGSSPIIDSLKLTYTAQHSGTLDVGDSDGSDSGGGNGGGDSCSDTRPTGTPNIYRIEPIDTTQLKVYFDTNSSPADEIQLGIGPRSGYYPRSINTHHFSDGFYVISDLTPNSDYFIHMRAHNGCRSGNWSNEVSAHTNYSTVVIDDIINPPVIPGEDGIKIDDIDIGNADVLQPKKADSNDTKLTGFVKNNSSKLFGLLLLPSLLELLKNLINYYANFKLNGIKLFVTGFIRRRRLPWGVVYDSVNKRPMDPVIVKLISSKGNVSQAVTDLYGRYSFIVDPGMYKVDIQKTNYTFPSTIIKSQLDEIVYEDVLTSTTVYVKEKETVNLNIPIDAVTRNWNEEEKVRMGNYEAPSKLLALIARVGFLISFGWSVFVLVVSPSVLNFIVFIVFAAYLFYVSVTKKYLACGYVYLNTGSVASGYVVELVRTKFPNVNKRSTVTDSWGRYSFLVERGDYKLRVYKFESNSKTLIYESANINVKSKIGEIDQKIHLA